MSFDEIAGRPTRERRRTGSAADPVRLEQLDLAGVKSLLRAPPPNLLDMEARAARALEQTVLPSEDAHGQEPLQMLRRSRYPNHPGPSPHL